MQTILFILSIFNNGVYWFYIVHKWIAALTYAKTTYTLTKQSGIF